jgi:hypothetical protein
MTDDQIIRLVLELAGQEKADQLASALGNIGTSARQAEASVDAVDAAMAEIAESSEAGARGIAKFASAQDRANDSKKAGAQALIELSRGLQDFQAAGLVGISNNIEGLAASVGKFATGGVSLAALLASPAGIVAGLTLLTTAAIAGGPTVKAYFDALIDGSNKVPEATDNLRRMEDRVKANNEALDDLRKKQSLTNTELATFNRLTQEQVKAEAELGRLRDVEAARKQFGEQATRASKDRAAGVAGAVNAFGGFDNTVKTFVDSFFSSYGIQRTDGQAATLTGQYEDIIARALKGDESALQSLQADAARPNSGGAGLFPDVFALNDPAANRKREADKKAAKDKADAEKKRLDAEEADRKAAADIMDAGNAGADLQAAEADKVEQARRQAVGGRGQQLAAMIGQRTNIDTEAGLRARQLRSGGMAENDIVEALQPFIARAIRQVTGGRGGVEATGEAARQIAQQAAAGSTAALLDVGQAGLQNQARLINVAGQVGQATANLMSGQQQHAAQINMLQAGMEALGRMTQEMNQGINPRMRGQMRLRR